jgi:UDP-galactopyranose mutase
MDFFDYLVVGAGFAGSVCAERLASAGKRVIVVDQRAHVGGNAYDEYDDAGILVHRYGPHIFHTNSRAVFEYLSRFTEWRPYQHRVLSSVDGRLVPFPINRNTLDAFEGDLDAAKARLIAGYTRKQWGLDADDLVPAVLARVAHRDTRDDRYFTDTYQAMPLHGRSSGRAGAEADRDVAA